LVYLKLQSNILDGDIPSLINLSSLESLDLSNNQLTGSLQDGGIYSLTNLRELYLNDNGLDGTMQSPFVELVQLTNLDLARNNFTGDIHLIESAALEFVDLSGNQFSGFHQSFITGGNDWSNLRQLYLNDNNLTDDGSYMERLENLVNIERLGLQNNNLSGQAPNVFNSYNTELQWVNLSGNNFSSFPDIGTTFSAPYFYELYLNNNNLSSLPENICNLPYNCYIDVSNNKLCAEFYYDCIDNFNNQDCD